MTGGPGLGDEELTAIDVFEATPVVAAALVAQRRRPRRLGPGRAAGVAAAALGLLVVGIAVGGLSAAPDPSASVQVSGDASATATTEGGACMPPQQGQFPAVTLAVRGTNREVGGLFGFGYGYGRQTQVPGWLLPPFPRALVAQPGDTLALSTGVGVCFRHLLVEYTATKTLPGANPTEMFDDDLVPSARTVVLEGLPDGDWVVRVTAHFDTQSTETELDLVTVSYFRILSGAGPFVTPEPRPTVAPTPLVTPAVPCSSAQPTVDVIVSLVAGQAVPVPGGTDQTGAVPEVHATLGDPIRMIVDKEICALSWNLHTVSGEGNNEAVANPDDDPLYAAQNRWEIASYGEQVLIADLHFAGGVDVRRTWRLVIDPFRVPALNLVGPDGTRFQASPGCGLYMHLANGYEASDDCGSIGYAPGLEALLVDAYEPIHVELPGWYLTLWNASCGQVTVIDTEQFASPTGCDLGGATQDNGGAPLEPAAFILPPGDTVVRLYIGAMDGLGNTFQVTYYAHVIAR
ncbi:MAG: hypothetical protein HW391_1431 [Chloroflexi bacterium]|nr:hypothetical protein [Chloroflexota bacterium]